MWSELVLSGLGFALGTIIYWLSLRYMQGLGIVAPEIQTLFWFAATIIGVAVASGRFSSWPLTDQFIAQGVALGLGWLVFRSAAQ